VDESASGNGSRRCAAAELSNLHALITFPALSVLIPSSSAVREIDGFSPLVYSHHSFHTHLTMARTRQLQPKSGPERALGSVLRELRDERRLSQLDVYERFGIDRTQLSAIERGVQSPTLRTIDRFAKMYRVSLSELMRRTEKSRLYR
jgi:DNA-binding XRE family transcriptional regulator